MVEKKLGLSTSCGDGLFPAPSRVDQVFRNKKNTGRQKSESDSNLYTINKSTDKQ